MSNRLPGATAVDKVGPNPDPAVAPASAPRDDDAEVLRRLVEGTVRSTGEEFFQSLVRNLSLAIGTAYCFVAEFAGVETRVHTLAFWGKGRFLDNVEFELAGTPCEDVVRVGLCHHPFGVQQKFPRDVPLQEMAVESYLGVPLQDGNGRVLGHLAVLDTRVMTEEPRRLSILQVFAGRAAAELERLHAERRLRESEQRFRDLYEEAPIAYIYEDTDSRFVSANRAAIKLLGLRPEEVRGTLGLSLVAPTPETQERVHQAIEALQRGEERACIELELRRKDDGRPVWVQWWSKPDPDGKYTRTMLVDITARVLAEQERNRLQQQNLYLREEIKNEYNFEEIVGGSSALREALAKVKQVAPTDSTVLILGETGTGKELIARALHNLSRRKDRPLIKLNCSALPTGLIESELFGHEKGAFTGALEKRIGRFALADGGTIFLDEIGDVPPEVQLRLLRVLQEHEFEPVGASRTVKVDVRVIAATHRDLARAVAEGSFRADLFYRLNVFPILLPALRERRGDIPLLVHYFVERYAAKIGRRVDTVRDDTMQRLAQYAWPGNIRELENVIERAMILSTGRELELGAQLLESPEGEPRVRVAHRMSSDASVAPGAPTLEDIQRQHIVRTLQQCEWVVDGPRGAARVLGLNPNTLRSRMKKLGIRRSNEDRAG
ncbi:MAG TPA: sigma 54-interacting transcriptional regulator [Candidatus Nitrosopolaris sp.]|nr:sigma 54-interacting transcriptional regulator [Candidatus Nitrosopolaris sp.]